jgi:hypothetical protein
VADAQLSVGGQGLLPPVFPASAITACPIIQCGTSPASGMTATRC